MVQAPYSSSPLVAGPSGIGGWLILPAIGLVLGPLRSLVGMKDYFEAFEIVESGTPIYNFIIVELIVLVLFILFSIYVAIKFFSKSASAPKLVIVLLILQLFFIVVDSAAVSMMFGVPFFDGETAPMLFVSLVACAIWIPYFSNSRRVNNTFIY
jgi:hypothetical protein